MTLVVLSYILLFSAVITVLFVAGLFAVIALVVYGFGGIMYLIRRSKN